MDYPKEFPRFAIGIPTLNRWDLLAPALHLYAADFPHIKIYVLDNGQQPCDVIKPNIEYIKQESNIGVSAAWNVLCQRIFADGNAFALIANDDVYYGKKEYDVGNLLYYHAKHALYVSLTDWCLFLISQPVWEKVGAFDEKLFAYYGDSDYERRLKLKGLAKIRWLQLSPMIYRNNSTGDKEPLVHKWALKDKKYYLLKWGGLPEQELFTVPFNNQPAK